MHKLHRRCVFVSPPLSPSHCGRHVCSWCSSLLQTGSHRSSGTCSAAAGSRRSAAACTPTARLRGTASGLVAGDLELRPSGLPTRTVRSPARNRGAVGVKRRLTRRHADFLEVGAAAVGGVTVLVTPAVGGFLVEHLEAATLARHDHIWRESSRK